jgi:hypothetical protein
VAKTTGRRAVDPTARAYVIFGSDLRFWPYDQSYSCICSSCANRYLGPKRSGTCWVCTGEFTKEWWEAVNNEKQ